MDTPAYVPIVSAPAGGLVGPDLQKRYDLHRAQEELGEKITAIPTLELA